MLPLAAPLTRLPDAHFTLDFNSIAQKILKWTRPCYLRKVLRLLAASLPAQSPGVIAAVIRVREACSRLPPPLPYTWTTYQCLGVC